MCTVESPVDMATEAVVDPQDQLRRVFDLCDRQGQGYIEKDAFHELGKSMFGGSEEVRNEKWQCQSMFAFDE